MSANYSRTDRSRIKPILAKCSLVALLASPSISFAALQQQGAQDQNDTPAAPKSFCDTKEGSQAPTFTIIGRVAEGTTVISGVTQPSASIEVRDLDSNSLLALQGGSATATADKTTGAITINLAEPLYSGQRIQFCSVDSGTATAAGIGGDPSVTELDIKALGDWGRVRAEFVAGAVLSFDNNFQLYSSSSSNSSSGNTSTNASQATLFLDFKVEKNWLWVGAQVKGSDDSAKRGSALRKGGSSTPSGGQPSNRSSAKAGAPASFERNGRVGFNTFFETRLTSVPVSVCATSAPASTTAGTMAALRPRDSVMSGDTGSTSNGTGCNSGATGNDALSTFLNSAKSAEVIGGGYLPVITSIWTYQGAPNALFLAPIARVGFITPTGSTTSGSTSVQPVNSSNFYNFYGFGGRLGHLKLSTDKNAAPELQSYIDVMFGRYSNLETLEATPNGDKSVRRWRVAIEGVLKVPATPLVLGVSANIGQNLTGPPIVTAAKDDLRFFIGARFDVGKLMAKVPQL